MPKNGDVTIKEGNRFVYRNGKWIKETEIKEGNRFKFDGKTGQYRKAAPEAPAKPPQRASATSTPARASRPAPAPSRTASRSASAPAAPRPASDAGMKNQDKNYKGSYVKNFKEETSRMGAASLSRQQGRSNLTSEQLKPTPSNASTPADKSKYVAPNGKPYYGPFDTSSKGSAADKVKEANAKAEAERLIREKNAKRDARYLRKPGTY